MIIFLLEYLFSISVQSAVSWREISQLANPYPQCFLLLEMTDYFLCLHVNFAARKSLGKEKNLRESDFYFLPIDFILPEI